VRISEELLEVSFSDIFFTLCCRESICEFTLKNTALHSKRDLSCLVVSWIIT